MCLSAGSSPSAGHSGFLLSAGNIRGTGLTVYDSDENIYKTVYAGGETEVSYEKFHRNLWNSFRQVSVMEMS